MIKRRGFIKTGLMASLLGGTGFLGSCKSTASDKKSRGILPLTMCTWSPNTVANNHAHDRLLKGDNILDALESAIWIPESDPDDMSVGYGGLPDKSGNVTLDACIMDAYGNAGSVMCLEHIKHPISVARKVMEQSPHVYIVGAGALQFALDHGFEKENLLSDQAKEAWESWLEEGEYDPMITPREILRRIESQHDTIGMLAIDKDGMISGGCSTSGLGFKHPGRVGDSPIIGSGLFVDNEVGAATGSGLGEEMAKICGAHVIVECMRHGYSPEEACKEAIRRIVVKYPESGKDMQVGFIACDKYGQHGGFAINPNFTYCVNLGEDDTIVIETPSWFD